MAIRTMTSNSRSPKLLPPGILVDSQICEAMAANWLSIDPFDPEGLQPATYDMRVGDMAISSTSSRPIDLRAQKHITIEPFASALLQTEETLKLSNKIAGRVGARSNLLRHGVFVSTGPQIDPGFCGRLFINLLNVSNHPFLIRYAARFLTIEFHALAVEPDKPYAGEYQNRTEFSDEQMNAMLGRGGPSLRDVHHALLEVQTPIKDTAVLGRELPTLIDLQQETLKRASEIVKRLEYFSESYFPSITVPIKDLGPEPYELLREIQIVIQSIDNQFTATFFDANISTSGETQEEAFANLKSLLVEIYEDLDTEPPKVLGPEPTRQLKILNTIMRRTS